MTSRILDHHHIARTAGPAKLSGTPRWARAFYPREAKGAAEAERYLSVNWLARWGEHLTVEEALQLVRDTRKTRFHDEAQFAVLRVDQALDSVLNWTQIVLHVEFRPNEESDPSHAGLAGYDRRDRVAQWDMAVAIARTVRADDWYPVDPELGHERNALIRQTA